MTSRKPIPGFFVTGTDTEVGKTLVSGALLLKLQKTYSQVAAFKPVVAGVRLIDGKDQNEDLVTLSQAANHPASKDIKNICPYILSTAAAPHLVAKNQHIELDDQLMINSYHALAEQADAIIVEGVGGFVVPFNNMKNSADFAKDIGLPVILVVGMRLGCINHALLTVEAIQARGLKVAGWVANTVSSMQLLEDNIQSLKDLIPAPLLGVIPPLNADEVSTPYAMSTLEKVASYLQLPHE